jgi:hypothetical protein
VNWYPHRQRNLPIDDPTLFTFSVCAQETHRGIRRNAEWRCRLRVATEFGKNSGFVLKVLSERLCPRAVGGMVRQKLRDLSRIGLLKVLE